MTPGLREPRGTSRRSGRSVTRTLCAALLLVVVALVGCGQPPTPPPAVIDDAAVTPPPPPSPDVGVPAHQALPPVSPPDGPAFEDFAGAEACADCHAERYADWARSVHGRAGGPATPETVMAPFNGRPLKFRDATVTPEKKGDRYQFVVVRGQATPQTYAVDGVVGAGAMYGGGAQTFFNVRADGLWVHLPFEYNVTAKRWFCQTAGPRKWAAIDGSYDLAQCDWPPTQALGFTGGEDCKNCHGSQIDVRYDETRKRFDTRLKSLHINCESCHGPAQKHVTHMKAGSTDVALEALDLLDTRRSTQVCLACHANKAQTAPGYLSGADFDDYFVIDSLWPSKDRKLSFDGRAQAFVYQQAHRYSPCYQSGSMTCVDCHDPHTLAYRDVYGRALEGRFDDGQCTGCHPAKGADHDQHPVGVELRCTDCHMTVTQVPGVGTEIPHGRADHAITVPNSQVCMRCHLERAPQASRHGAPEPIFGQPPPHPLTRNLMGGGSVDLTVSELTADASPAALVAVSRLVENAGRGMRASATALTALSRLSESRERDIAGAALAALIYLQGPDTMELRAKLTDATMRRIVSYNLAALTQFEFTDKRGLASFLSTAGRRIAASTYLFWTNLGRAAFAAGMKEEALSAFTQAVEDPHFDQGPYPLGVPGTRAQLLGILAELHVAKGQLPRAMALYERALALAPHDGVAGRGRCQLLARMNRPLEAARCLGDYLAMDPDFLPGHFIRADLLARVGHLEDALKSAQTGYRMVPDDPEARRLVERLQRATGRGR